MPVCFENPKWCNAAALGTPPEPCWTCDTDPSSCLNRADTSQDQLPILVLNTEPSFTSTSSHAFHTPNSGGVLRRDLEPAEQAGCVFLVPWSPSRVSIRRFERFLFRRPRIRLPCHLCPCFFSYSLPLSCLFHRAPLRSNLPQEPTVSVGGWNVRKPGCTMGQARNARNPSFGWSLPATR